MALLLVVTASRLVDILRRRVDTPPDSLVLSILQPCSFFPVWGVQIYQYIHYQQDQGRDIDVGPCVGFWYIGVTPDGICL